LLSRLFLIPFYRITLFLAQVLFNFQGWWILIENVWRICEGPGVSVFIFAYRINYALKNENKDEGMLGCKSILK